MMTHDEMIAVIQAHKDGKPIEFCYKENDCWEKTTLPLWNFHQGNYRVAPEPPKPEYVPWETVEDVVPNFGKHIKNKNEKVYCIISVVKEVAGCLFINSIGAPILFQDFIFADGTPCGKLVVK